MSNHLDNLYVSLSERWMPETVVEHILNMSGDLHLSNGHRKVLESAKPRWRSYMSSTYAKADDLGKYLSLAEKLFGVTAPTAHDPVAVLEYMNTLKAMLGTGSEADFKTGRLSKKDRKAGLVETAPKGRRMYNRQFRLVRRMMRKYEAWQLVANMRDLTQIGKSRLATRVTKEMFTSDVASACFIAYLAAKLNKRSIFTFGKQERAYDNVADVLFKYLGDNANWFAIAHVYPEPAVLNKLTEDQKGQLLGLWYNVMVRAAKVLKEAVGTNSIDMRTFIVRRGNDSSTWNEAAGAFNKARESWINLLYAMGGENLLVRFAPGKALRLMAADVAWGHRAMGDGLEPDTAVWGELPKPWEVVLDGVECNRAMIEQACKDHNIQGKGWIAPRPKTVAVFKPSPELVHGVVVSSPALAQVLSNLGYFGGPSKSNKVMPGYVSITKEFDGEKVVVK